MNHTTDNISTHWTLPSSHTRSSLMSADSAGTGSRGTGVQGSHTTGPSYTNTLMETEHEDPQEEVVSIPDGVGSEGSVTTKTSRPSRLDPPGLPPLLPFTIDPTSSSSSSSRPVHPLAPILEPHEMTDTVIHFPDSVHSLDLITFPPAQTDAPHSPPPEGDSTDRRRSLKNRLSQMSLRLGRVDKGSTLPQQALSAECLAPSHSQFRQGSKDSNATLLGTLPCHRGSIGGPKQEQVREDLKDDSDGSLHSRTQTAHPAGKGRSLTLLIPPAGPLPHHHWGTSSWTPSTPGTGTASMISFGQSQTTLRGPKQQSSLLHLQALSPASATSPGGKRYHDPRQRNKGRKSAFKTAKTLFSNERTFIHWIKFGMLLGALAMTLLNFSGPAVALHGADQTLADKAGKIGQWVGAGLLAICLVCLAYAAAIFHWRHHGVVRRKEDSRYFDRIGPTLITVALLIAYGINIILTIQVTANMDPNYLPSVFYNHPTEASTPPAPSTHVFDTPRLPPGATIMVDDEGDDDDEEVFYTRPQSSSPSDTQESTSKPADQPSSPEAVSTTAEDSASIRPGSTAPDQEDT